MIEKFAWWWRFLKCYLTFGISNSQTFILTLLQLTLSNLWFVIVQLSQNRPRHICLSSFFKYTLFDEKRFFSTQLQCCLNFSRIELQMLLRCSLVHHYPETHFIFKIFVTMSRPMSRSIYFVLCDLYFIFSLIFIVIIHITSSKQTHLFFFTFSRNIVIIIFNKIPLDDSVDEEREYFSISKSSALGCFLAFA